MLGKKVEDISLKKGMTSGKLVSEFSKSGGFTAKKLAVGVDILEHMVCDKDSLNFLSFPAAIIATGARGVIRELVKRELFDVVITTCGTLDHDIARSYKSYHHGSFFTDDRQLHKKGINRLGNVFIPNASYGIVLEKKIQPVLASLYKKGVRKISAHELIWEFGRTLKKDSILYWCQKNKIPVIVPGITDGAFGTQLFLFQQDRDFSVDIMADEKLLSEMVFPARRTGALMIGGGISKHHTIWWNQFAGGLSRAVYLTSAPEWDGSLSGARIREAISWGKARENAKYVTVEGDATINLPLMVAALLERI